MRPTGLALLVMRSTALIGPVKKPFRDYASETGCAERTDVVFFEPWENSKCFEKGYINSIKVRNPSAAAPHDVRYMSRSDLSRLLRRRPSARSRLLTVPNSEPHYIFAPPQS